QIWATLFLYLSIRFYANPGDHFVWKDTKHLVVPLVFLMVMAIKWRMPELNGGLMALQIGMMFFQIFFYVSFAYLKVKRHRRNLLRFESSIQSKDLNWLDYILAQLVIISVIALVSNVMGMEAPGLLMNSINLV